MLAQLELVISALILLTAFIFLLQSRIHSMITTFVWQSGLLVSAVLLQAIGSGRVELYISAGLTFLLKVLFVPYLLRHLVQKLNIRHKVATVTHPFLLLFGAAILVLFCYHLIVPLKAEVWALTSNVIAVAMAVMLLGMLILITHRKAISHVIGFMSMENGIFFAALIATEGMPMTVELGIAFDVLVATVLFGVFFLQLRRSIDSLDVDRLNRLREDVE
jgi:hydrogenase-4 component E